MHSDTHKLSLCGVFSRKNLHLPLVALATAFVTLVAVLAAALPLALTPASFFSLGGMVFDEYIRVGFG